MTKKIYGTMPDGRPVEAYTLDNGLLKAEVLTYGAALNKLFVPDRNGSMDNILLTFDSLEERLAGSQYQGEIVGRYANRIARAQFTLNEKKYDVTPNEDTPCGGSNCLHGGGEFSHDLWQAAPAGDNALELTFASPAGAHGFPGQVRVTVRYLLVGRSLAIKYEALSSADTILNLTNHAYFNLAGRGDILSHLLQMKADCYLPVDENAIPTGELRAVEDTPFDFRSPKPIGQDIQADDPQLGLVGGYDHNFCNPYFYYYNPVRVSVSELFSGRHMTVETDLPGVQLYTGNQLPIPHTAFCLETQAWPDSPNQWPDQCLLKAGETYKTTTRFDFSTKL